MRKASGFLVFFVFALVLFTLTLLDAAYQQSQSAAALSSSKSVVSELGLSDLALSTEARYTRNLSLADRHSAFQDHPVAFDYFPSGSLFQPPRQLVQ